MRIRPCFQGVPVWHNANAFAPPRAQDGDDGSEYAFFKTYGASPFGTARADDDERSEGSL